MANGVDSDRARKTLYVTGFSSKTISKHLLEELFTQGGPVKDVTMFDTHAYILFQHEESVPYCLALFNDIELYGQRLRLSPRSKSNSNTFDYLKYLRKVRETLKDEYMKMEPPNLPPKKMPQKKKQPRINNHKSSSNKRYSSYSRNDQTKGSKSKHKPRKRSKVKKN